MIIGLGFDGGGVVIAVGDVSVSALAIATFVAIVLNLVLPNQKTFLSRADDKEGEPIDSEMDSLEQPIDKKMGSESVNVSSSSRSTESKSDSSETTTEA